ncbi:unnamed protein product [Heterobilharzia americana]|nr:unnamed protein product [Heterobilharzia americana]
MMTPIQASDADLGVNALITYSLLNPNKSTPSSTIKITNTLDSTSISSTSIFDNYVNSTAFFRIDPITGKIWTIQSLDCENRSEYHLIVVAKDSGVPISLSSSASVIITVEDANDNVPEFVNTHYLFEVLENAPGGTEIGIVEALDKDVSIINQRVRYTLRGNAEDLKLITVDRNTGILRTRRPIDRESRSSISLIVEAENEVPVHRSPSMRSENFNMIMKHIGTEASVVITILNVNDNRPEFTLIEPHRSHVTFTWEQLNPLVILETTQSNVSSLVNLKSDKSPGHQGKPKDEENHKMSVLENANPVCEPLPHRVIDRDMESDTMLDCCILELLDNYNGLFALIPQAPSVLCAMYRPPSPQTYKLTLIAKDGLTNDSLSSQVHFTVIIRSDPNLRISEKSTNPRLDHLSMEHLIGKQSNFDYTNSNGESTRKTFKYAEHDNGLGKDYLYRSTNIDNNINAGLLYSQSSTSTSHLHKSNHLKSNYGYGHQTLIIIVMASIAGVLCALLLVAIILTKRCTVDTTSPAVTTSTMSKDFAKEEQNNQNNSTIGMKSLNSTGSTPSKTKTFNAFPVSIHHIHPNPDYYAKEMIYHHPIGPNPSEAAYDISLETVKPLVRQHY